MIGVSYGFALIFMHIYAYTNHTDPQKHTQFMVYTIQKYSLFKACDYILAAENEAKTYS